MLLLVVAMVHHDVVPKSIVSMDVKSVDVEPNVVPKLIVYMDLKPIDVEINVGK